MMRGKLAVCVFVAVCLLCAGLCFSGCGKKSAPVAPGEAEPARPVNLAAEAQQGAVLLTWSDGEGGAPAAAFEILRYDRDRGGPPCPGCPRDFKTAGKANNPWAKEKGRASLLSFADKTVSPGGEYVYKVLALTSGGRKGPESVEVMVQVPEKPENR
jgi:hypothetical protein